MSKKILATALIVLFTSAANAEVLSNGDFEIGTLSPAWTATGNVGITGPADASFYFGGGSTARDGNFLVAFNSGDQPPNGVLSQTFATSTGTTYRVNFDYGTTRGGRQQITADILDPAASLLASSTVTGINGPDLQPFNFSFVADGSFSTLRFTDFGTNNTVSQDGLLDNVSVSAVPEPTTVALVGLGLLGFVASRRKSAK